MTHADQDICQLDIRQFDIRQFSHLPIRQWPIQTFANLTFANHGKNVLTSMKMFTIVPLLCFMFEIFFISHHVLNIFLFNAMFGKKKPFLFNVMFEKKFLSPPVQNIFLFNPMFEIFLFPCYIHIFEIFFFSHRNCFLFMPCLKIIFGLKSLL